MAFCRNQELSNSAWAFSKLSDADVRLTRAFREEVVRRMASLDPQALANLADSVPELSEEPLGEAHFPIESSSQVARRLGIELGALRERHASEPHGLRPLSNGRWESDVLLFTLFRRRRTYRHTYMHVIEACRSQLFLSRNPLWRSFLSLSASHEAWPMGFEQAMSTSFQVLQRVGVDNFGIAGTSCGLRKELFERLS